MERAYGCLAGVAVGDAIGMAVELMTHEQIRRTCTFVDGPIEPVSDVTRGLKKGQVTDDTELTLLIAEVIASEGRVTADAVAKRLVRWALERNALELPYIGPSTKSALRKLLSGVKPHEAGRGGETCGAATRVSPVGIVNFGDIEGAVSEAAEASIPTHNTEPAISAAAAVASAVAEAIVPGSSVESIIRAALLGAKLGARCGGHEGGSLVAERIEMALEIAERSGNPYEAAVEIVQWLGPGVRASEVVPAALGIFFAAQGEPREVILAAVNAGGDTDSVASIAAAVAGAFKGVTAIPKGWLQEVERVNNLDLRSMASKLVAVASSRRRESLGR